MADVRLDRAQRAASLSHAVDRGQAGELDGVADGCAGAVRLHQAHVARVGSGSQEGLAVEGLLGLGGGRGQDVGAAVLVDGRAADQGQDAVVVP